MEPRKQKEIAYYDTKAKEWIASGDSRGDFEGFNPFALESYQFLQKVLKDACCDKRILDYGCGNGVHSVWLAQYGGNIVAIDLSSASLEVAKKYAEREGVGSRITFTVMDCEHMTFLDNSFDIIFDGGTFSSLDITKAFPELARVLKPDGFLIGIETLAHNPFLNFNRKINKRTGKRTVWAADHIFKMEHMQTARKYFENTEAYFFHLVSWAAFPFLRLPGGKILLAFLETIDRILLFLFPFLKKYSFKIVFVFKNAKKGI